RGGAVRWLGRAPRRAPFRPGRGRAAAHPGRGALLLLRRLRALVVPGPGAAAVEPRRRPPPQPVGDPAPAGDPLRRLAPAGPPDDVPPGRTFCPRLARGRAPRGRGGDRDPL